MYKKRWQLIILLIFVSSLYFSCGRVYYKKRILRSTRWLSRNAVLREKRILRRRLRRWRIELRSLRRLNEDIVDHRRIRRLRNRVRLGRQVLAIFRIKLRNHGRRIPFSRYQWRKAYRAGCRKYR